MTAILEQHIALLERSDMVANASKRLRARFKELLKLTPSQVNLAIRTLKPSSAVLTIATWTLLASFMILANPQGLMVTDGLNAGHDTDRVDSWSDHIVRNTVTHNVRNGASSSYLPIYTEGYFLEGAKDYSYSPDGVRQYGSNLVAQSMPLTLLATLTHTESEPEFKVFFAAMRVVQGIIVALLLMTFTYCFAVFHRLRGAWISPLLVGTSVGIVYFAQNLYFAAPVIIAPAVLIALQVSRRGRYSLFGLFVLLVFNFLRGYEFASIAALLPAFAAMIFMRGEWKGRVLAGLKAFGIAAGAFISAVLVHAIAVGGPGGWIGALSGILGRAQERNLSTTGVPSPLGNEFFAAMQYRWTQPALQIAEDGLVINELAIIIALLFVCAIRAGRMTKLETTVLAFGFLAYSSWYVAGYQHIMVHNTYDWYIFALTLGTATTLLLMIYIDRMIRWWTMSVSPLLGGHTRTAGGSTANVTTRSSITAGRMRLSGNNGN